MPQGKTTWYWNVSPAQAATSITTTSSHATITWNPLFTGTAYINACCDPFGFSCVQIIVNVQGSSCTPPSINFLLHPNSVCEGQTATITASASGTAPLSYQWQVWADDGGGMCVWMNVTGANSASFTTPPLYGSGIGCFPKWRCVVTNACGQAISGEVGPGQGITIQYPPSLPGTISGTSPVCSGTTNTYSISAVSGATSYTWEYTGGGTPSGTGTSVTLTPTSSGTLRVRANNACGSSSWRSRSITVNLPPSITSHPPNRTICAEANTTFGVTASGAGLTYQWQVSTNGGGTYTNLANIGPYANVTTATMSITGATAAMNNYRYRCVVSGTCTPPATSNHGVLTISETPIITNMIYPATVCEGQTATITVSASGTAPLSYQWQVWADDGGGMCVWMNVTGANSASFTTPPLYGSGIGCSPKWRCVVTNSCGQAISGEVGPGQGITIPHAPHITSHPPNRSICAGANTTFGVSAIGAGLTYQWQLSTNGGSTWSNLSNGGVYSNVTTATMSITGATAAMNNYRYRCVASGTCTPPATSNHGTLTISPAPQITSHPPNRTICAGANTTFGVTASGAGLTYQWQVSTNGGGTYANLANIGPYANVTTATMSITGATAAMNNYRYRCVVSGTCTPPATSNHGTLTINESPLITNMIYPATVCEGQTATITVSASGTAPLSYQWQVWADDGGGMCVWMNVPGANSASFTTPPLYGSGIGCSPKWRCVVTNSCGQAISGEVGPGQGITIPHAPHITSHPPNRSICAGANTTFGVSAIGAGLTYQWQLSTNGGSTWSNLSNGGVYSNVTTATMSITGATAAMNNYRYRCVVSGTCTPPATSNHGTLTISPAPQITSHPPNRTICAGANTTFGVTASGAGLTYQWQVSTNGGGTYANLANIGPYANVTTATMSITGATAAMNNYRYRCVVSGTCTPPATSNHGTLTINESPLITNMIYPATVCEGQTATITVSASGTAPLSYQWQVWADDGGGMCVWMNVTGANSASFTTPPLYGSGIGCSPKWRCVVTNSCGQAISGEVGPGQGITIPHAPHITSHPPNRSICAGANTTFGVSAIGAGLTYQWQLSTNGGSTWSNLSNGGVYSNVTTATMSITGATAAMNNYRYRCVVSGTCTPPATSNHGTLTISPAPQITSHPPNRTICAGANTTFGVTASGAGLTYQWQVSTNGGGTYTNLANIGPYANVTTATMSITGATAAMNNYRYRCVVSGTCTPPATSNHGVLTISETPIITNMIYPATVCEGQTATITVSASGTAPLSYQWQVWADDGGGMCVWMNVTGANSASFTTPPLYGSGIGCSPKWRCVVTNSCGQAISGEVGPGQGITIPHAPHITSHPPNRSICAGANTTFGVSAIGAGLTYQWQLSTNGGSTWSNLSNGGVYSNVTTATMSITGATAAMNNYRYRCVASGTCTPPATSNHGTLTISPAPQITSHPPNRTICAGANTTFGVTASGAGLTYQWQVSTNGGGTYTNLANIGPYANVTTATMSITGATAAMNNYRYRCVVSGTCTPPATSNHGVLTISETPIITNMIYPATVCEGQTATITVSASGTAPLSYQWQVWADDGGGMCVWMNVTGANSASFTTPPLYGSGIGCSPKWRCVVTNSCGQAISGEVGPGQGITIPHAPHITSHPPNRSICAGANTTFGVSAIGAGLTYQWQLSTNGGSTWSNLSNGGVYSNVTTATMSITGATAAMNNYRYRCVVSGTCTPPATSNHGTLTISPAPQITSHPPNRTICEGANTTFGVTATGTGLTYQWQVSTNGGGTYTNLINIAPYANVTTATMSITGATAAMNNYRYRCVVSGTCTPPATSNHGVLTISETPIITNMIYPATVCEGQTATITVSASGTAPLSYQWQVWADDGGGMCVWMNVPGANSASFTTPPLYGSGIGCSPKWRCVVTNSCGQAISGEVGPGQGITIPHAPHITSHPPNRSICAGANTTFGVSAIGAGLTYQWQLSTNGGSTWSNLSNGGVYSNVTTATMSITGATAAMNNYRYRCVVSGTCTPPATSNHGTLTVNTVPAQPSAIAGATAPCQGTTQTYNVTNVTGVSYAWTVPTGWTITTGQGTNSITVTVGTANGNITVTPSNSCGNGTNRTLAVTTTTVPAQPSAIAGATAPCQGTTQTYNVTNVTGVSYAWTVPTGWTITTGQGTNSITVTVGTANGNITVTPSNSCGNGTNRTLAVTTTTVPAQPSAIAGATAPCQGTTQTYNVTNVTGVSYAWTVPTGWTITTGQGTNSITVTVGTANGNITVTPSNSCGNGTNRTLAVTTTTVPAQPSAIAGATAPCQGTTQTYNVTNVTGVSYAWTVPTGWTITTGQGTNSITVTVGTANGNITVTPSNSCGNGTNRTLAVTTTTVPAQPSAIAGATAPCQGTTQTYNVTNVTGVSYAWTVPTGWTITTGQGTNSITVTVGTANGNITVTPSNSCGNGTNRTLAVTTTTVPAQPSAIAGATAPCQGTTQTYNVTNVTGVSYAWTVPTGWTITTGQGTNSITVTVGTVNGNITVTPSNSCGNGTNRTLAVTTTTVPAQPSAIAGATAPCQGTTQTYNVTNVTGVSYAWTVPTGWTITTGQGTNSITVTVGTANGNITVTPSNSCGNGTNRTLAVTTTTVPAQPSAIAGATAPCQGTTQTYNVTNVTGVSYAWTVPTGWTITTGQGTNSITVTVGTANGNITVTPSNSCGNGTNRTLAVTTTTVPAQPSAIAGATAPCQGTTQTYNVTNVTGVSYAWTVPTGWTITTGQGTNSITVTVGTANGNITVTPSNSCGNGTNRTLAVTTTTVPAQPSAIAGATAPCQGTTQTYNVTNVTGVSYAWTVPTGWTITTGQGTNSITVTVGTANGNITVTPSNSCGNGTNRTLAVTTTTVPAQPSAIAGATAPCQGTTQTYNVTNVTGVSYAWTVPTGWTITTGQGTNSITVTVGTANGNITVTPSNSCGNGTNRTLAVTTTTVPAQPSAIAGATAPCQGTTQTYNVTNVTGVSYAWTVPTGWTITTGQGTNSITVTVGTTNGNITVTPSNSCGNGTSRSLNVNTCLYSFSGRVLYAGSVQVTPTTPNYNPPAYVLQDVEVVLEDTLGDTIGVQLTDVNGAFNFTDIPFGDYTVKYNKQNNDYNMWIKSQHGIDVTDYMMILSHIANPSNPQLLFANPYYQAIDVNNDGVVNVVDRAQIQAKILDPFNLSNINNPNYFTHGNWINLSEQTTIDTDIINHEGIIIAAGDYNGSASGYMVNDPPLYTIINWSGAKTNNYIDLIIESSDVHPIDGSMVSIPVNVATDLFGIRGYQIEMTYPHDKFKLVSYNLTQANKSSLSTSPVNTLYSELLNSTPSFTVSDINGVIRILCAAEVTHSSFDLLEGNQNSMFELIFEPTSPSVDVLNDFSLFGMRTTFVDEDFTPYHNVNLTIPSLTNGAVKVPDSYSFENLIVYPNPTQDYVNIEFNIVEPGQFSFSITDILGRVLIVEPAKTFSQGKHTVKIDLNHLSSGIYNLNIHNSNNNNFSNMIQTVKIVVQ
jgi:hypothetical protein